MAPRSMTSWYDVPKAPKPSEDTPAPPRLISCVSATTRARFAHVIPFVEFLIRSVGCRPQLPRVALFESVMWMNRAIATSWSMLRTDRPADV